MATRLGLMTGTGKTKPEPAAEVRDYNEYGEWWGECPYCGTQDWLGYKDHCRKCLGK